MPSLSTHSASARFSFAFSRLSSSARRFTSAIVTRHPGHFFAIEIPITPQPQPRSRTSPAISSGRASSSSRVPVSTSPFENTPASVRKRRRSPR